MRSRAVFFVLVAAICLVPPWHNAEANYGGGRTEFRAIWRPWGHIAIDVIALELGAAAALCWLVTKAPKATSAHA